MSERRPGLGKLSQRYLKDDAYTAIKSAITSMTLKPGDACMESAIASELGISKTPVRSALDRLDAEGLVETIPFKGTYVRPVSVRDVREILEARRGLEGLAVRLWIERVPVEATRDLRALIDHAGASMQRGEVDDATEAIREFHAVLIRRAGNARLTAMYRSFSGQMARIRNITGHIAGRVDASGREHLGIVEAIEAADVAAAEAACHTHLQGLMEAYASQATVALVRLEAERGGGGGADGV